MVDWKCVKAALAGQLSRQIVSSPPRIVEADSGASSRQLPPALLQYGNNPLYPDLYFVPLF